jgi:hypothetical protein
VQLATIVKNATITTAARVAEIEWDATRIFSPTQNGVQDNGPWRPVTARNANEYNGVLLLYPSRPFNSRAGYLFTVIVRKAVDKSGTVALTH